MYHYITINLWTFLDVGQCIDDGTNAVVGKEDSTKLHNRNTCYQ